MILEGSESKKLTAPVVLDLNRVSTLVEQHLASRHRGPCRGRRQGDLAATRAVEHDVGELVAVRAIVHELQVVQLGLGGRDAEGDLVLGDVEALDVTRA